MIVPVTSVADLLFKAKDNHLYQKLMTVFVKGLFHDGEFQVFRDGEIRSRFTKEPETFSETLEMFNDCIARARLIDCSDLVYNINFHCNEINDSQMSNYDRLSYYDRLVKDMERQGIVVTESNTSIQAEYVNPNNNQRYRMAQAVTPYGLRDTILHEMNERIQREIDQVITIHGRYSDHEDDGSYYNERLSDEWHVHVRRQQARNRQITDEA